MEVVSDPWKTFRDYLSSRGLRVTNQRHAIFQAAYHANSHYTAEDLLTESRAIDSTVSRATVYRTLPILIESGLIREVDIGKDYKYYMANRKTNTFQAQVFCIDNDQIHEIDAPFMEWYGKAVADKLGLEVVSQRLQVHARLRTPEEAAAKSARTNPDENPIAPSGTTAERHNPTSRHQNAPEIAEHDGVGD
ncbi:MAG: Fur family transcriptional regulator [Puniceicoccaceae bacterium]